MSETLDPRALRAAHDAAMETAGTFIHGDAIEAAITAYLSALPQPQAGEPVAWRYKLYANDADWTVSVTMPKGALVEPLFASPQPANPAQVTDAMVEALNRFERAAMAYERLGKMSRDDEKTRVIRKDTMAELAQSRAALTAAIGAGSAEPSLLDRERAAMDVTQRRAIEGERIADAVLAWMVKYDLLDAGSEYHVSDVLAVLDDLAPSYRSAAIGAGGQAVAVKPLDLSNLLKHAFSAGYVSAAGDDGWTDYDPTKCAAYVRILSALSTAPATADGWRDMSSAPKDGTHILLKFPGPFSNKTETGITVGVWTASGWWWRAIWAMSSSHTSPVGWHPLPAAPTATGGR